MRWHSCSRCLSSPASSTSGGSCPCGHCTAGASRACTPAPPACTAGSRRGSIRRPRSHLPRPPREGASAPLPASARAAALPPAPRRSAGPAAIVPTVRQTCLALCWPGCFPCAWWIRASAPADAAPYGCPPPSPSPRVSLSRAGTQVRAPAAPSAPCSLVAPLRQRRSVRWRRRWRRRAGEPSGSPGPPGSAAAAAATVVAAAAGRAPPVRQA
mmetsp:Transcript_20441/g.36872  ORF Transcript_20441/g.36872 Transcript_20441/m.36872 type:complete len:213 (-) Transcript_20441:416-1054(-)